MGPLKGIKILEFAGIGPGPFCGMLLADLGAEVIKINRPESKGNGSKYDLNDRSKFSITIDLKNDIAKTNIFSTIGFSKAISKNFTIETFLSKDKYNKISSLINLNIVIKE